MASLSIIIEAPYSDTVIYDGPIEHCKQQAQVHSGQSYPLQWEQVKPFYQVAPVLSLAHGYAIDSTKDI